MKRFFLLLAIIGLNFTTFSQTYQNGEAERFAPNAKIVRFRDGNNLPTFIQPKNDFVLKDVNEAIEYTKNIVKIDNVDFVIDKNETTSLGEELYRFTQTINGVPIEFSSWKILMKDGIVKSMSGDISQVQPSSFEFLLTEEQALAVALAYIDADQYMWQDEQEELNLKIAYENNQITYYPKGEKVFVSDEATPNGTALHQAYKFNIYSKQPFNRQMVYVDALTGEIILTLSLIHFDNEIGTAYTGYSGVREINTESYNGSYRLNDNTRGQGIRTFNCQNTTNYTNTYFTDDDNIWNNVNPQLDQYATDAHFGAMKTYDYYLEKHNRNSIDGAGFALLSYVHFNLIQYGYGNNNNAFWDGQRMTYGDGSGGSTPFTAIDIAGHEISHGLTSFTANLTYSNEPGALNESFSDIFGTAVEWYAVPIYADWDVGEDVGSPLRSMSNPKAYNQPDTYHGINWYTGSGDNGGVHYNSGVFNYWYYMLCVGKSGTNDLGNYYSVPAIGMEKASAIAFRTLTVYLSPSSNYADVYFYATQATIDLYGACTPETQAVGNAFYAIGVAPEPSEGHTVANFSSGLTESCTAPFTVNFTNNSINCESSFWDFGDGTTSTLLNPNHTYQNFGTYHVKLIANGGNCGVDSILKSNFITIDNQLICTNVMPSSGTSAINACAGLLFDAGGPNGNYPDNSNATVIIHSAGATSIILEILELDIEPGSGSTCNYDRISFYNGPNASSPKINNTDYCNTTGNPGTIASTGEYITIVFHSDMSLNLAGFKIFFHCEGVNAPPIPNFQADHVSSCDGKISFSDLSHNNPTSWLWSFGDGTTDTTQNPTHQYLRNGIYSVSLAVANEHGAFTLYKNQYVSVAMTEIALEDTTICTTTSSFTIDLNISADAQWYESPYDTIAVHTGNYWQHPLVSFDKTYYVRELSQEGQAPGGIYHVGPTNNTSGGGYFGNASNIHYLIFDAFAPFTLQSVSVNAQGAGVRNIALRTSNGTILAQKSINIPNGVSRVTLDMEIPQLNNLQLVGLGVPNLYRTNTASYLNYPYTLTNVLSIKGSSASDSPYGYYYYFYDWEVEVANCKSEFLKVTLEKNQCNSIITTLPSQNITVAPNPSTGLFTVFGLDPDHQYHFSVTNILGKNVPFNQLDRNIIDLYGFANGIYFLKISDQNSSKVVKVIKE